LLVSLSETTHPALAILTQWFCAMTEPTITPELFALNN
jgi:hypothetical protein